MLPTLAPTVAHARMASTPSPAHVALALPVPPARPTSMIALQTLATTVEPALTEPTASLAVARLALLAPRARPT